MRRFKGEGQRNPVLKFVRSQINSEKQRVLTGSELIDRVFELNTGEALLIRSKPYAGSSALCFEFISWFTKNVGIAAFIDCNDAYLPSRTTDFNDEMFMHIRPTNIEDLLNVLYELREVLDTGLIVLDQAHLLNALGPDDNTPRITISNIVSKIRSYCPNATIIATDGSKHTVSDIWNKYLLFKNSGNYYDNREWVGHFISIYVHNQKIDHFISYRNGRLSKVYEHMTLELESGKDKGAFFEWEGVKYKGFWNTLNKVEG